MGYETYLVEIIVDNESKKTFVQDLAANQFKVLKSSGDIYLEREYKFGIVEIYVSDEKIFFRYAKPNLKDPLTEFLELLQEFSKKYPVSLYDFHSKKRYEPNEFSEIAETYEKTHNEFCRHFPDKKYHVKSEEVFK